MKSYHHKLLVAERDYKHRASMVAKEEELEKEEDARKGGHRDQTIS